MPENAADVWPSSTSFPRQIVRMTPSDWRETATNGGGDRDLSEDDFGCWKNIVGARRRPTAAPHSWFSGPLCSGEDRGNIFLE
jgi:hypothetical protein